MNSIDYAYGVAYIRSIENNLFSKADFENLIAGKSRSDALQLLNDKGYPVDDTADWEDAVDAGYAKTWETVLSCAPEKERISVLLYENDFANLKTAVKGMFTEDTNYRSLWKRPCTVDPDELDDAVINRRYEALPESMRQCTASAIEILTTTMEADRADAVIDKTFLDYSLREAEKTGSTFFGRLLFLRNTQKSIGIAYRGALIGKDHDFFEKALPEKADPDRTALMKSALSGPDAVIEYLNRNGYAEEGRLLQSSLSEFETYCDNQYAQMADEARFTAFGIEPLIAFILKKQTEIKNIRIILTAKFNGIDEAILRKRLRELII